MITIKEYAESRGKTTQSVYKMISNHKTELKGCINKKNGVKNITPKGVEILDGLQKDSVEIVESGVIIDSQMEEELKRLRDKVESLQDKVITLTEENGELKTTIINLQSKENAYINQVNQLLLEQQKPKGLKAVLGGLFNKNTSNSQKVDNEGQ